MRRDMAPRAASGKNVASENLIGRAETRKGVPTRGVKSGPEKKAKETQKRQRSKLKGWLETEADWAKFDAWAKTNAQPRKKLEPEQAVRGSSKPLAQLKKRIEFLAQPHNRRNTACRTDVGVSKKALIAKPSKRILELAMFVARNTTSCREFPITITREALRYKTSRRIIEISRPRDLYLSEHCNALIMSQDAMSSELTARRKRLILIKKGIECPNLLTDKEIDVLMTPAGIYRSALAYKFTPWMNYLSLPSYRFLKDRMDYDANEWKKFILEENDSRGKRALEEKTKRKKCQKDAIRKKELDARQGKKGDEKTDAEEQPMMVENEEDSGNTLPNEKSEENADDTSNKVERDTDDTERDLRATEFEKKIKNKEPSEAGQRGQAGNSQGDEKHTGNEEAANERKAARNAWRFEPPPNIDNPFAIKRSALKGKVSLRMAELAVPHSRKDRSSNRNPFVVRKSALEGPVPERIAELSRPLHPRGPVEPPVSRERDSFGRPLYPMPLYGKKMPLVKPYQSAECPDEVKNDYDVKGRKGESIKRRSIDPIVYEATIDPCVDPERAKNQWKARKFFKEEIKRRKNPEWEAEKYNQPPKTEEID